LGSREILVGLGVLLLLLALVVAVYEQKRLGRSFGALKARRRLFEKCS
jgi:hypothetical protein